MSSDNDEQDVVTMMHFAVIAQLHGNYVTPGVGTVHRMEKGKIIELDSYDDSWIPSADEPFHDQVRRVFFTKAELARRAEGRRRMIEVYSRSPIYRAAAEKDPTFWETFDPGGRLDRFL